MNKALFFNKSESVLPAAKKTMKSKKHLKASKNQSFLFSGCKMCCWHTHFIIQNSNK